MAKTTVPPTGLALSRKQYAVSLNAVSRLAFRYHKHTSKLILKLGDSDIALQHNNVINLKLAVAAIDGVVISICL